MSRHRISGRRALDTAIWIAGGSVQERVLPPVAAQKLVWRARSLSGPGNTASLIGGHGKGADWVSWDDLYQWDSADTEDPVTPWACLGRAGGLRWLPSTWCRVKTHVSCGLPGGGTGLKGRFPSPPKSSRWSSGRVGRDRKGRFPSPPKVSACVFYPQSTVGHGLE